MFKAVWKTISDWRIGDVPGTIRPTKPWPNPPMYGLCAYCNNPVWKGSEDIGTIEPLPSHKSCEKREREAMGQLACDCPIESPGCDLCQGWRSQITSYKNREVELLEQVKRLRDACIHYERDAADKIAPLVGGTIDMRPVGGGEHEPDPMYVAELWVDRAVEEITKLKVAYDDLERAHVGMLKMHDILYADLSRAVRWMRENGVFVPDYLSHYGRTDAKI